jgi:hypothetical protein
LANHKQELPMAAILVADFPAKFVNFLKILQKPSMEGPHFILIELKHGHHGQFLFLIG